MPNREMDIRELVSNNTLTLTGTAIPTCMTAKMVYSLCYFHSRLFDIIRVLTFNALYGIMKKLHKRFTNTGIKGLESKKDERRRLCSNKAGNRSSFLEFKSNSPFVTEEMKIDYLAGIIVDIFLEQKRNAKNRGQKEGGDIL